MNRRKYISKLLLIIFIFSAVFIFLILFSPAFIPTDTVHLIDGGVWKMDNDFSDMPFPVGTVYMLGDVFCHQKESRSFLLNDNQMPFCSRCTAIFFGLMIGILFILFYKIKLSLTFLIIFLLILAPLVIDGVMQGLGFWESNNIVRVITGFFPGLLCGFTVGIFYDEIKLLLQKKNKIIKN
jgi:uncharacterized membrane protein